MLDTTYAIETPEGVRIRLRVAGASPRALATLIDISVRWGVLMTVASFASIFGQTGWGIFTIIAFITEWFYPVLFEIYWEGQTPGKRAFKLLVVHEDGTPVSWRASILRNLLRFADMLPLFYGFGLISAFFTERSQRLGDLVAGTLVVYREERSGKKPETPEETPLPPPRSLTLDEQKALIGFGERGPKIHEGRRRELAEILNPLTGKTGEDGLHRLYAYTAWLVGSGK